MLQCRVQSISWQRSASGVNHPWLQPATCLWCWYLHCQVFSSQFPVWQLPQLLHCQHCHNISSNLVSASCLHHTSPTIVSQPRSTADYDVLFNDAQRPNAILKSESSPKIDVNSRSQGPPRWNHQYSRLKSIVYTMSDFRFSNYIFTGPNYIVPISMSVRGGWRQSHSSFLISTKHSSQHPKPFVNII